MNRAKKRFFCALGLLVLSGFFVFHFANAIPNIVAKPALKTSGYSLEITEQVSREDDVKIARNKFCLVVCFAKEIVPNLAHIKRSISDLISDISHESTPISKAAIHSAPKSIKNLGASLKDVSEEILERTKLTLNEFSMGLKYLTKPVNKPREQRAVPIVSAKQQNSIATASLLDRLRQFLFDLLGFESGIKQIPRIVAIPLMTTKVGQKEINLQGGQQITRIQPTITNQIVTQYRTETKVVDDIKLAALTAQLELFKKSSTLRDDELFKLIALTSQISNLGPRGNTPLTIGSPTFTGQVSGLDDDDIPNDITISSSKALSASSISTSGNLSVTGDTTVTGSLTVSGAQTFTGGTNFSSNLGIGTSTPGSGLSVGSGTSTLLAGGAYVYGQLTAGTIAATSTTSGFGTSSPYATLSVEIPSDSKIPAFVVSDFGTSAPALAVAADGNVLLGTASSTDTPYPLQIYRNLNNFVGPVVVNTTSGNVAAAGYFAGKDIATLFLQISYRNTGGANSSLLTVPNSGLIRTATGAVGGLILVSGESTSPIIFGTGGGGFSNERARIDAAGNVGIGNKSPAELLDVAGNIGVTGELLLGNGVTATSSIRGEYGLLGFGSSTPFGQISIEASSTIAGSSTPIFVIGDSGSSSPFLIVSGNDGSVGISTATPGYTLGVGGFGLFKGNLNVEATSTASSFIATSTLSVGTTSPATASAALSVQGNTYITGGLGVGVATTSPGGLFVKGSADIYDGLVVRSGGTEASSPNLFVKGGKVGIGTAAPTVALDIVGGISASTNLTAPWWNTTGSGSGKTVFTMTSNGASYGDIQVETVAGGGVWSLGYQSAPSATIGTAVLTWNGTGQVGLSTTTPYGQLAIDSLAGTVDAKTPVFVVQDSGTSTPSIYVDGGYGRVGFGTSSPKAQVAIEVTEEPGNDANEGIPAFVISARGTSTPFFTVVRNTSLAAGGGMFVGVGTSSPNGAFSVDTTDVNSAVPAILVRAGATANVAIQVDSGDNCKDGADAAVACALNDLAELFPSSEPFDPAQGKSLEAGDIAIFDTEKPLHLRKTANVGSSPPAGGPVVLRRPKIAGVISTSPAIVFEGSGLKALGGTYKPEENKVPLTLSGRVPVKVNLEGGEIKIGDPITISSIPGVGKKATESGQIVGYALESSQDPEVLRRQGIDGVTKIVVLANLENWTATSTSVIASESEAISWVASVWNALISKLTEWFQTAVVAIKELKTEKLCVGSTCVNEAQLQALLNGNSHPEQGEGSASGDSSAPPQNDSAADVAPPVITLNGANPAEIEIGSVYSDMGVTVTDNVSQNLGYKVILKQRDPSASPQDDTAPSGHSDPPAGGEESPAIYPNELVLDTSAPAEYTIVYTATDQAGNTGTATRTVRVIDPYASPVILNDNSSHPEQSEGSPGDSSAPPQNDTSTPAPEPTPEPVPAPTPTPEPVPEPTPLNDSQGESSGEQPAPQDVLAEP